MVMHSIARPCAHYTFYGCALTLFYFSSLTVQVIVLV